MVNLKVGIFTTHQYCYLLHTIYLHAICALVSNLCNSIIEKTKFQLK